MGVIVTFLPMGASCILAPTSCSSQLRSVATATNAWQPTLKQHTAMLVAVTISWDHAAAMLMHLNTFACTHHPPYITTVTKSLSPSLAGAPRAQSVLPRQAWSIGPAPRPVPLDWQPVPLPGTALQHPCGRYSKPWRRLCCSATRTFGWRTHPTQMQWTSKTLCAGTGWPCSSSCVYTSWLHAKV